MNCRKFQEGVGRRMTTKGQIFERSRRTLGLLLGRRGEWRKEVMDTLTESLDLCEVGGEREVGSFSETGLCFPVKSINIPPFSPFPMRRRKEENGGRNLQYRPSIMILYTLLHYLLLFLPDFRLKLCNKISHFSWRMPTCLCSLDSRVYLWCSLSSSIECDCIYRTHDTSGWVKMKGIVWWMEWFTDFASCGRGSLAISQRRGRYDFFN